MPNANTNGVHALKILDHRNDAGTLVKTPIAAAAVPGTDFASHMVVWQWDESTGWHSPEICPYGPIPFMPSASVFQYATCCFEGIKVYIGHDGALRLFRTSLNCERMAKSSERVGLPPPDPESFEVVLKHFGALVGRECLSSTNPGQTLYLRPTHVGTTAALGLQKPRHSLLYVIATLQPGFSAKGKGLRLITSPSMTVRAWPGGFGDKKVGANYGTTLPAHNEAICAGFDQVLWLFGEQGFVTEAGASNFFVVWKSPTGELELVTAGLDNGTILEGVTRRSVIELVQTRRQEESEWQLQGHSLAPLKVVERNFTIDEVRVAAEEGRLVEAFATGTAYFVAPAEVISHLGKDIHIPTPSAESGSYALLIKQWLSDIVFGKCDPYGWTQEIEVDAEWTK